MSQLNSALWLMDTIRKYGRITLAEISRRWLDSPVSEGRPLPRRSFHNYRMAAEKLFNVTIDCDTSTYEYYIREDRDSGSKVGDWLLNSSAINSVLSDAREVSSRILFEDVPSAREYLHQVVDALKADRQIKFSYHSYSRFEPTPGVVIEPYFLKIFRQRWYVTGRNIRDRAVKTYALDRMSDVTLLDTQFHLPDNFNAEVFCSNSFGVIFNNTKVVEVTLRADDRQSKYLRALPLHATQKEIVNNGFSLFKYELRLTPDFVSEILSLGPRVTVIAPEELKVMVKTQLLETLRNYE
ncbi:MAG: WYL domain-containing protein [Bacteroidales bacterium]|nr:WYL domain-containing protein [Bacteroidales bacterium]MBD5192017.1 WYL domain-containing protein [Bacteroidales bacterium]MBD5246048.1 WYL domain-containing protein [Barnesiella sp.]